jgi:hypothetical protein
VIVLAHAGHWAVGLIYMVPIFIVVAVLSVASWRDRRTAERETSKQRPNS